MLKVDFISVFDYPASRDLLEISARRVVFDISNLEPHVG